MHVSVHRDIDACVSKNLTQALDIKAQLDTSGRKCVAKSMKIDIINTAFHGDCFESVFRIARFHIAMNHPVSK